MDKNKDKNKEKTPAIETFPTDETPTPTKILRMADMDPFFSDLKENPFDLHFRKATEAVKQGADIAMASLPTSESESLNTPQIYVSEASSPSVVASRPVILRSNSHNRIAASTLPVASVQPVAKQFKAIAPSPVAGAGSDNALLLLKFPGGETLKLTNLPFVKCDSTQSPSSAPMNQETKLKLKRVLNSNPRLETGTSVTNPCLSLSSSVSPPSSSNSSDDLKERNRMSAQRSRVKKRQHIETLLESYTQSQNENQKLSAVNKMLLEDNDRLRRLLAEHLDCSVTLRAGTRELLAQELDLSLPSPDSRTHNIQTQTSITEAREEFPEFPPPPQTHPEDLRVDTRIKNDSHSSKLVNTECPQTPAPVQAPASVKARPVSGEKGKTRVPGDVKATLAKHCRKVGTQRSIKANNKGVVARRLKDKLKILKEKLAEDENTLSDIKSGNLK